MVPYDIMIEVTKEINLILGQQSSQLILVMNCTPGEDFAGPFPTPTIVI